jgi:hypothetical protein
MTAHPHSIRLLQCLHHTGFWLIERLVVIASHRHPGLDPVASPGLGKSKGQTEMSCCLRSVIGVDLGTTITNASATYYAKLCEEHWQNRPYRHA